MRQLHISGYPEPLANGVESHPILDEKAEKTADFEERLKARKTAK